MKKSLFSLILVSLLASCSSTPQEPAKPFKETFVPKYTEEMKTECAAAIQEVIDSILEYQNETDQGKLKRGADSIDPKFEAADKKMVEIIDEYYVSDTYAMIDKETYDPLRKEVDAAYNELYNQYMMMFYHAMHSPLKTYLLSPEDIAELEGYIDNFADTEVQKLKDEITELEDSLDDASAAQRNKIVFNLVNKRNALAKKFGYNNYYEYSSKRNFYREYSLNDTKQFRNYVKKYFSDFLTNLYYETEDYSSVCERMGKLYTDTNCFYNESAMETLTKFFDSLEDNKYNLHFASEYTKAKTDDRIITPENGEDGAFTQRRNCDGSYMYFAPTTYYSSASTVTHEYGHYMYSIQPFEGCDSYDLKETHSQTDEKLYQSFYLSNCIPALYQKNIEIYEKYVLLNDIYSIVLHSMIDDWELAIYSNKYNATGLKTGITSSQYFTTLKNAIVSDYNFLFVLSDDSLVYYFQNSSCYEISYAISLVPVLGMYCDISSNGYADAVNKYCRLLTYGSNKDFSGNDSYVNVLNYAGLTSPFDESLYTKITEHYTK